MEIEKIQRILLVNLGGIGDNVLATPAYKAIRKSYNKAHIVLLADEKGKELVERLPYFDEVITISFTPKEVKGLTPLFNLRKMLDFTKMVKALRQYQFDIAVNMCTIVSWLGAFKIGAILVFSKAKCRIGRNTDGKGFFFHKKLAETYKGKMYERDYYIELAKLMEIPVENNEMEFIINDKDRIYVDKFIKENIPSKNKIIAINPSSGWLSRRWQIQNFAKLIELLPEEFSIVVIGAKNELELGGEFLKHTKRKFINAIGRLSIYELGAFLKKCACFITNDSGPMHIAEALNVPTVAIFGSGDVERFASRSKKSRFLYKPVECSPCNFVECPKQDKMKCFKIIVPDEVFKKALEII